MRIECAFFGGFREAVGEKTVHRETDVATVGAFLREIESVYPALEGALITDEALSGSVAVTVDGTHLQQLDGLTTALEDGAVVRITQAIHGG